MAKVGLGFQGGLSGGAGGCAGPVLCCMLSHGGSDVWAGVGQLGCARQDGTARAKGQRQYMRVWDWDGSEETSEEEWGMRGYRRGW